MYTIENKTLTDIADAIREKTGKSALIKAKDMAGEIQEIQPVLQQKTATQNGTITPDAGYDGLSSVTVDVQGGGGGGLPDEYTALPYIESSGNQYIDTGVSAPNGAKVTGELCFVSTVDQYDTICGVQSAGGTSNDRNAQIIRNARSNYYSIWSGASYQATSITISYGTMAKVLSDNRGSKFALAVEVQNVTNAYSSSVSTGRVSNNLFLFALNDGGTAGYFSAARIKQLEIYDASGTLVRDFYAARRNSDGTLGLYDKISNTFFTNQGTGDFTTG